MKKINRSIKNRQNLLKNNPSEFIKRLFEDKRRKKVNFGRIITKDN